MGYVAKVADNGKLWDVGFYRPDGEWEEAPAGPEFEDRDTFWSGRVMGYSEEAARAYVHYLNGGGNNS